VVATMMVSVGCSPDAKTMQIQALQERVNELERENQNLQGRLASAMDDAQRAANRALQLQGTVDDLNRRLAEAQAQGPSGQDGRWTIAGDYAWTDVGTDVLFDSGKADLKPAGKSTLREIQQEIMEKFPGKDIWVVGHTDTDPINKSKHLWKDNLDLSQGRARAAAIELITLGLDPKRVIAGGQGEHNPKQPNSSKQGKAQNRRVQIVAVPHAEPVGAPPPTEGAQG
jgi:chemotaxis protein MotB